MNYKIPLIMLGIGSWLFGMHLVSYRVLKTRIVRRQKWGLNICCGKTDGGGVNADIMAHTNLPKLVVVDVEHLPFRENAFETVLSSHTLEHVANPDVMYAELTRVGESVTLVLPPLWDLWALVNVWEHQWVFLTFKKEHHTLPPYIPLPFANKVQAKLGQIVRG